MTEPKKYNCPEACPKCGSDNIDVMDDDRYSKERIALECVCLNCRCQFDEEFVYDYTIIAET